MAFIFLFLFVDELASIHERVSLPEGLIKAEGLLYFSWIIPYGIGVLVFVTVYLKFLMKLSSDIRVLFVIAGTIFV